MSIYLKILYHGVFTRLDAFLLRLSNFPCSVQSTGASIQVANEMLPGSTERAVTISGSSDTISPCIRRLCAIAIEVIGL